MTGTPSVRRLAAAILIALLLPAGVAVAETVEEDVAACRLLTKREKWAAAADAWKALFTNHGGSAEVVRLLPEIEEGLQLCLFRKATPRPNGQTLYGIAVKKFDDRSRKIELAFVNVDDHPLWITSGALHILDLRMENDVSVQFTGWFGMFEKRRTLNATGVSVYFCWDPDLGVGYRLHPGFRFERAGYGTQDDLVWSRPALIERIDPAGDRELYRKQHGTAIQVLGHTIRAQRSGGGLRIYTDGKLRASASDRRHKGGFLAIGAAKVRMVDVKGRLEEKFHRQKVAAWLGEKYAAWRKNSWVRAHHIPAWTSAPTGPEPTAAGADLLPSDAPEKSRKELLALLELRRQRKVAELIVGVAKLADVPERTGLLLRGLADLALSAPLQAEAALSKLVEAEPGFGGGWLYRGIARFRLRRMEEAKADLKRAAELGADPLELALARSLVALFEGNVAEADRILADARARGIRSEILDSYVGWFHRAKAGPRWTQRYEYAGRSHVVRSDHSQDICKEVGKLLETSLLAYLNRYARVTRPAGKVRVYVFASRKGFLTYAGALGHDLESAAGAYNPITRELLLWMPEIGRAELMATVRHEGFHGFLHAFVEHMPPWLNEGYAQYFERGKISGRKLDLGDADLDLVRRIRGKWRPTREAVDALLGLDQAAFMADASANYARAWALVHFLESTSDRKLRALKDRYFEELRAGRTPAEAKKSVFDPVLDRLAEKFDEHWSELLKKTIEK